MQTIEHWTEWRERCALALCGENARRFLPGFVHSRFVHFLERYASITNVGHAASLTPSAADAWHWFETHFVIQQGPGGKCYKSWLFEGNPGEGYTQQEGVEAGAAVLIRTVVREWLRRERSARWMVSLHEAAKGTPDEETVSSIDDLLPGNSDTRDEVEQQDLERIALADAPGVFSALNRRERIALLAHEWGVSLTHPGVLRAAECGRNAINSAFHGAMTCLAGCVRARHPREEASVQASLACLIYGKVRKLILSWEKTENLRAHFCMSKEGPI